MIVMQTHKDPTNNTLPNAFHVFEGKEEAAEALEDWMENEAFILRGEAPSQVLVQWSNPKLDKVTVLAMFEEAQTLRVEFTFRTAVLNRLYHDN